MPLLDHFTEPVPLPREWESFHSYFAVAIGRHLNATLPDRFVAAVQFHSSSRVESDVAEFDRGPEPAANGSGGGTATLTKTAAPPATGVFPAVFPDDIEVRLLDERREGRLVAVVELVSESNKDRPESRAGFAGKCAAYLQRGVGVVIFDPVHVRRFNLHDELMDLLRRPPDDRMPADTPTCCTAYQPEAGPAGNQVRYWAHRLAVGSPLPAIPLALKGWGAVILDLEALYTEACRDGRAK
ncbi:MAG: DUF4058 family protein [Gemmataceae bacterium]|nr:DUF4058 family protein [Gemmataceae bacterium]